MKLTPEIIIKTVADYFKLSVQEVISTDQHRDLIIARHLSIYFIRDYLKLSLPRIGKNFAGRNKCKDHATCISAIKSVKNQVETDKCYKSDFDKIKTILDSMGGDLVPVTETEEQIKESVLVHENYYLKSEIVRLKNEVSVLRGRIYGMKINKRNHNKKKKPDLFKLADIKPVLPVSNSISRQFISPYAGVMSCNDREMHGYREHSL